MERVESLKAKERQEGTQFGNNMVSQNSDIPYRTDDMVAEKLGIGSRDTEKKNS